MNIRKRVSSTQNPTLAVARTNMPAQPDLTSKPPRAHTHLAVGIQHSQLAVWRAVTARDAAVHSHHDHLDELAWVVAHLLDLLQLGSNPQRGGSHFLQVLCAERCVWQDGRRTVHVDEWMMRGIIGGTRKDSRRPSSNVQPPPSSSASLTLQELSP